MSHSLKLALGLLCVVALAGFLVFTLIAPPPGSKDSALRDPDLRDAPLTLADDLAAEDSAGLSLEARQRRSEASANPRGPGESGGPDDLGPTEPGWTTGWVTLSGRFVNAQRQPVRNVPLYLRGRFLTGTAKDRYDELLNWRSQRGRSDAKGAFSFRVRVSPQFHLTLETKSKAHVNQRWEFKNLQPGEVRDLGDLRISQGGTILGEVRRADGSLLVDGWRLRASHADRSVAKEINKQPSLKEPGTFTLENLQEGPWRLNLRMEGGLPDGGRFVAEPEGEVQVEEGKVARVVYRYEGPALRTRLHIDVDVGRIKHVHPRANHVTLSGPAGVLTVGTADEEVRSHTFEDIAAGTYVLRIDDPRFQPVRVEGLETGPKDHKVEVRGNVTLTLLVRDARTQRPVERYNVKMREWKAPEPEDPEDPRAALRRTFGSWVQNVKRTADFQGGKVVLDDIAAGSYVVMVDADGRSRTEVDVLGLSPNEKRTVEIDMLPGGSIRGVVVDADGKTPREGVKVAIQPASADGGDERWARMGGFVRTMRGDTGFQQIDTDARGRFAFEGLTPGAYAIRAQYEPPQEGFLSLMTSFSSGGSGLSVEGATLTVNHGQILEDVRLVLPPSATIRGRVLGPPGADFTDLQLSFQSVEGMERDVRVVTKLDQEGRFAVGPVYPTVMTATLLFFDEESPFETFREGMASKELGQVTLTLDPAEEIVLDARPHWPSRLQLVVETASGPLAEARVSLEDLEGESQVDRMFRSQRGETNAEGKIVFSTVMAGPKRVTVTSPERRWTYVLPTAIQVTPGSELERAVRIELHRGRVRFLDVESGAALVERAVAIIEVDRDEGVRPVEFGGGPGRRGRRLGAAFSGGDSYRTDASGFVELELPAGNYMARLEDPPRSPAVAAESAVPATPDEAHRQRVEASFTWGPGGAAPPELRVGSQVVTRDK